MRVKVPIVKVKEKDPLTGEIIEVYKPDIGIIDFSNAKYDIKNNCVIIDIHKEDFEKIKDKVLEIIEK